MSSSAWIPSLALPTVVLAAWAAAGATLAACPSVGMNPQNLNFGTYNGSQVDVNGSVQVFCNGGNFSGGIIALETGGSGTYTPRKLANGANRLNYNLYLDVGRNFIWGDGAEYSGSNLPNNQANHNPTIYARIPGGQSVPSGTYTDTVVITVYF